MDTFTLASVTVFTLGYHENVGGANTLQWNNIITIVCVFLLTRFCHQSVASGVRSAFHVASSRVRLAKLQYLELLAVAALAVTLASSLLQVLTESRQRQSSSEFVHDNNGFVQTKQEVPRLVFTMSQ